MIDSVILAAATRLLMPLLLIFSLFMLLRGHNEPGGGFIGGLIAATAFALHFLAFGREAVKGAVRTEPRVLLAVGLLVAFVSGLWGIVLDGKPFLSGVWATFSTPIGDVKLGTPLLFDLGVYLVVLGMGLGMIIDLSED